MSPSTKAVLDAIVMSDESLTLQQRDALHQFVKQGVIRFVDVQSTPLMLNATKAAELLGVSMETFKKVRDQAAFAGVEELRGVEITPGNFMFSRIDLVRLSLGEFDLKWSAGIRLKQPFNSVGIDPAHQELECAG